MMVYTRIANPYMPQGTSAQTNAPTPFYAPGEIGTAFNDPNTRRACARVMLDSGATSATPVGAVAAGQIAFWKDRNNSIVTNDKRFANVGPSGSVNYAAGIFQRAVSTAPGITGADGKPVYYVCDIVISGHDVPVASDGNGVAGQQAVVDTTANTARVTNVAVSTAAPNATVGVITGPASANLIPVDVQLGFID